MTCIARAKKQTRGKACEQRANTESGWRSCAFEQLRCFIEKEGHLPESHQDHIANKGYCAPNHCGSVHTPVPVANAMKLQAAKGSGRQRVS